MARHAGVSGTSTATAWRPGFSHTTGRRTEHRTGRRTAGCPAGFSSPPLPGPPRPGPTTTTLVRRGFLDSPCCSTSVYDTDLRFRRSTQSGRGVLGLSDDDLRGLRLTDVLDDPVAEKVERAMRRVLETGETQYLENHALAPGEARDHAWSVHLYRLEDPDGRVLGVASTGHDMTEQYWARKRLQLIAEAGTRIGSTLDVTRTAQELANVAVPELADFVSVDLLASLDDLPEQPPGPLRAGDSLALRRIAHQSVFPDVPEAVVALGEVDDVPGGLPAGGEPANGTGRAAQGDRGGGRRLGGRGPAPVRPDPRVRLPLGDDRAPVGARHHPGRRRRSPGTGTPTRSRRTTWYWPRNWRPGPRSASTTPCRYTRERGTAVTLQRSLLPQRPARAVRGGGRLPLPPGRCPGRSRRGLVRRDPAVRGQGGAGRGRRRGPRHPRLGDHGPAAYRRTHARGHRPAPRRTAHPPRRPGRPPRHRGGGRGADQPPRGRARETSERPACTPCTTPSPAGAPSPGPGIPCRPW